MNEADPTYTPPEDRAAGLGHTRTGIRRRARWAPLVFLVVLALVVGALAALRGTDRLESEVRAFEFVDNVAFVEIAVTNTGDGTARVLGSPSFNAGSSAIGPVQFVGAEQIGAGETEVFVMQATVLCEAGATFSVEPFIRIEDRQKGRWIVYTEPGDWTSEPVTCR